MATPAGIRREPSPTSGHCAYGEAVSSSIFVIGEAKAPSNNPITNQFGLFFLALVIDPETHRILDAECTATLALTKSFVKSLIAGARITDADELNAQIALRYHGSSQRALIAAVTHAAMKYRSIVALNH